MASVAIVRGRGGLGPVQFVTIMVGTFRTGLSLEVRYYSLASFPLSSFAVYFSKALGSLCAMHAESYFLLASCL